MFDYFGYGSNMSLRSLQAKGVTALDSRPARLYGWRLRFNVRHFFRHEGGMGNIEPTGKPQDCVQGVLHRCDDDALALLDAAEAYGYGYGRVLIEVEASGAAVPAFAYVGMPAFIDDACLPTQRYLNILLAGADHAGLDAAYIDHLRDHPLHPVADYPPFVVPSDAQACFDAASLAQNPCFTALAGAVFDMSEAQPRHEFLKGFFGGRDMTLFHLQRMDSSDGLETLEDVARGRLSPRQRAYLNAYLHEYNAEYRYVGGFQYDLSQV